MNKYLKNDFAFVGIINQVFTVLNWQFANTVEDEVHVRYLAEQREFYIYQGDYEGGNNVNLMMAMNPDEWSPEEIETHQLKTYGNVLTQAISFAAGELSRSTGLSFDELLKENKEVKIYHEAAYALAKELDENDYVYVLTETQSFANGRAIGAYETQEAADEAKSHLEALYPQHEYEVDEICADQDPKMQFGPLDKEKEID